MTSIILFGDITGGHFNPAVTTGVFTSLGNYGQNFVFYLMIMLSQFAGAFLAIGMSSLGNFNKPTNYEKILCP
jgi:glycerol uptake facilitator-like aquaporin